MSNEKYLDERVTTLGKTIYSAPVPLAEYQKNKPFPVEQAST